MLSEDWLEFRQQLADTAKDAVSLDLRWSYLVLGALVAAGAVAQLWLPHGWTAWPIVLSAALLVFINEAADRNGEGIPPLTVYAFFSGAVLVWLIGVFLISSLNPIVLLLAVSLLGYQCARGVLQTRARRQLMEQRRMAGQCVHCGEPAIEGQMDCENCGGEVNPQGVRVRASTIRSRRDVARTRAALKPLSTTAVAAAKEQALLARRHRRSTSKR